MSKQIVNTNKAPGVIGPFNQGIIAGNLLFTSGQLPMHPATGAVPEGIEAQTIQVLENLKAIIEAGGASLGDVVKTTVYLQRMSDFAVVNKIYATYFQEYAPARACVEPQKCTSESAICWISREFEEYSTMRLTKSFHVRWLNLEAAGFRSSWPLLGTLFGDDNRAATAAHCDPLGR
jgi:2-iminobutanoate/2-iminopropanoate deaminase